MLREHPDVVVGFGGYVSIPVGLAAAVARVPLVIHEQNSIPGLANRLLGRVATVVAVTYAESAGPFKRRDRVVVTGNPVREQVLHCDRSEARAASGLTDSDVLLLVFGGSRGARHLNEAMAALAPRLLANESLRVLHVTGPSEFERTRAAVLTALGGSAEAGEGPSPHPRWRLAGYLDDMAPALHAADLVVARAGATSIAEITAVGVPALLVPYPFATDDHQTRNAAVLVATGAADVVADRDLDGPEFSDKLLGLIEDRGRRATMSAASKAAGRTDAAERVAAVARAAALRKPPALPKD